MNMCELIVKKKRGGRLNEKEIDWIVQGYTAGEIPDYQMSAMLMAICFTGMDEEETKNLTLSMAKSGDLMDLSAIHGKKIDKHSTGGVGDKTTLVIGPLAAAAGVPVAKMSGRGLGHTGGTIDKLESFHGFHTSLTPEQFIKNVNSIHIALAGQTANLAPADKKIYALRDVTGTVDQMSLIASSIMSKKLASGADGIVLDVKTGDGAFMKTLEDSVALAKEMVSIGENAGKRTVALITNMDIPLGHNIGNSLEVIEAVETLKGNGPQDLTVVCMHLASNMLYLAGKGTLDECKSMVKEVIANGKALEHLAAMVRAQGGDDAVIWDTQKFAKAPYSYEVCAKESGYITFMDTESCGIASAMLGAGRETKDSGIDFAAGIIIHKKVGDYVEKGESLATMYASREELFEAAAKRYLSAVTQKSIRAEEEKLVYARVTKEQVEYF